MLGVCFGAPGVFYHCITSLRREAGISYPPSHSLFALLDDLLTHIAWEEKGGGS